MDSKRRQILQYSAAGSLLGAFAPPQVLACDGRQLCVAVMPDGLAFPRFKVGELLLVDTSKTMFDEDGVYFYPAWGNPRPWQVIAGRNHLLEFRNPGSGQLAWTQSRIMSPLFAGKLGDPAGFRMDSLQHLPSLRVPALPEVV